MFFKIILKRQDNLHVIVVINLQQTENRNTNILKHKVKSSQITYSQRQQGTWAAVHNPYLCDVLNKSGYVNEVIN